MRYILNSAVITTPGIYRYKLITVDEAKTWLNQHKQVKSAIGYHETADALQQITGVNILVERSQIQMQEGDEALVFRLTSRITDDMKGKIGTDWILNHCETGILRKLTAKELDYGVLEVKIK